MTPKGAIFIVDTEGKHDIRESTIWDTSLNCPSSTFHAIIFS